MPKVSLIIPYHDSPKTAFFLQRLLNSIDIQTFKDYEIILSKVGLPGKTINEGIRRAKGELIKIMCQDDWFTDENSLRNIVDNFKSGWLIAGSHNNPKPRWTNQVPYGYNTLGGLSTITMLNQDPVFFDDEFQWMIDIDFYVKAFKKWGEPTILEGVNINVGIGDHQLTNSLSEEEKRAEHSILFKRYEQ